MPLKPVTERVPLYPYTWTPLRPGQIRTEWALAEHVYREVCKLDHPAVAEGALRLAYAVSEQPNEEAPVRLVRGVLDAQAEDGALPGEAATQLRWCRAAFALAEASGDLTVLGAVLRWVGWCAEHLSAFTEADGLNPLVADLLDLIENLYLLTGKKAFLALADRLRDTANDWCVALHTFNQQRPSAKIAAEELDLRADPVALADGFRASSLAGSFTGSGKQLSAPAVCWQKLSRYHASVAGGTTAAPCLEGASPAAAQSAASVGAWLEALSLQARRHDQAWAWWELEKLIANALPASVQKDGFRVAHAVNQLQVPNETANNDAAVEGLGRIARAVAATLASAVCMEKDGIRVQFLLPGSYTIVDQDRTAVLRISPVSGNRCVLSLRGQLRGTLRIRIPSFTDDFTATLAGGGQYLGESKHHLTLRKDWHSGDTVSLSWQPQLHTQDAHHQGKAVYLGDTLLAMPADEESYAAALCAEPELRDGKVWVKLAPVIGWKLSGTQPGDIPVLPVPEGEAADVCLSPFASLKGRIALFPSAARKA